MKPVCLQISTFSGGYCPEASHFYGWLAGYDQDGKLKQEPVEFTMTARQARDANRREKTPGLYKKGSRSSSFDSEKEVAEAGKACYKTYFPDAHVLYQSFFSCCDPKPVIDGPEEFVRLANEIYRRFEVNGFWEAINKEEAAACWDDWNRLIKRFDLNR